VASCHVSDWLSSKSEGHARADILEEMCRGNIRPAIQELADQSGAYIIVSSQGSISDTALQRRGDAMTEAIQSLGTASALAIDFYDRHSPCNVGSGSCRCKPVGEEQNRQGYLGWQSYGAWAYPSEGVTGEYLLDDKLRIQREKINKKIDPCA